MEKTRTAVRAGSTPTEAEFILVVWHNKLTSVGSTINRISSIGSISHLFYHLQKMHFDYLSGIK